MTGDIKHLFKYYYYFYRFSVLVFQSCHKETPQTGWLNQQEFIFSQFQELEVQDDRSGFPESSLLGLHITASSHSLSFMQGDSCCLCIQVFCYLCGQMSSDGIRAHFNNFINHLFKDAISKYSHFWGVRSSTY